MPHNGAPAITYQQMKKNKEFMDWSYGEGETPVSVNIDHIASHGSLEKFMTAETSKSLFAGYGDESRKIRMQGLYAAVMEKAAPKAEKTADKAPPAPSKN